MTPEFLILAVYLAAVAPIALRGFGFHFPVWVYIAISLICFGAPYAVRGLYWLIYWKIHPVSSEDGMCPVGIAYDILLNLTDAEWDKVGALSDSEMDELCLVNSYEEASAYLAKK